MNTTLSTLAWTEGYPGGELVDCVRRLESLGFHELWLPERAGREPFSTCGFLLAKTTALRVSCGIANIYVRDADAVAQGRQTLAELSGGRFSLGLGVSHRSFIEPRGHTWEPPAVKMRTYLERIAAAPLESPAPGAAARIVIAAHGPHLWRVAKDHADGILTHLLTPETVRSARQALGPGHQIHALVRCVLDEDAERARDAARRTIGFYLSLPSYHRPWHEAGFDEPDWRDGGSDRLVDALCAWGSPQRILDRLGAFSSAGASHIVVVPITAGTPEGTDPRQAKRWDWKLLEALAPVNR